MKALGPLDLVLQNLFQKPLRTSLLVLLVALFALTLFCSSLAGQSISEGTALMAKRLGADILFVPHGYDSKIQAALLRGEPSSFYLNGDFERDLRQMPGIVRTSSQLYVASLSAACCSVPVQIIGFDPQSDFVVYPWIRENIDQGHKQLGKAQLVVGNRITGEVGDKLLLFGKEFTIAAKLDKTGMGFDTSVFMDIGQARGLLLDSELVELPENLNKNTFVSSTLAKMQDPERAKETANAILQRYAVEYDLDFVLVSGMISGIAEKLQFFSLLLYALSGLIWLLALAALGLVFSVVIHERRKEFGLLRLLGATRWQLSAMLVQEALLLSACGAFAGLVLAGVLLVPLDAHIAMKLQVPSLRPGLSELLLVAVAVFGLALLTGPLASAWAALRLGLDQSCLNLREEV